MNSRKIRPIVESVEGFLGETSAQWSLVLAPDNERMFIAYPEELRGAIETLTVENPDIACVSQNKECPQLSLLVNSKCNFHCAYCYASESRTNEELSADRVIPLLDHWFARVASERISNPEISFSGGGEPLLSMERIEEIVSVAEELAQKHGCEIRFSLVTNGSLLNERIIDYLEFHRFKLFFSFEVIEDLQRSQRGVWEPVRTNLLKVLRRDISCVIKCVITRESMTRQLEMAKRAIEDFPGVRRISFNQMELVARSCSTEEYKEYLDNVISGFFMARRFAARHGVVISSYDYQTLSMRGLRCCPLALMVTPHGGITFCTVASSPKEKLYPLVNWGEISSDGKFDCDELKIHSLRNYSVNDDARCRCCAAREYCGGGCPVVRACYSFEQLRIYCEGRRKFLAYMALEKIETKIQTMGFTSLSEWLDNYPAPNERMFSLKELQ